jgi:hypothetical protein
MLTREIIKILYVAEGGKRANGRLRVARQSLLRDQNCLASALVLEIANPPLVQLHVMLTKNDTSPHYRQVPCIWREANVGMRDYLELTHCLQRLTRTCPFQYPHDYDIGTTGSERHVVGHVIVMPDFDWSVPFMSEVERHKLSQEEHILVTPRANVSQA